MCGVVVSRLYLFLSHRRCVAHDTERPVRTPSISAQQTLRNFDTLNAPLMAICRS